jgi:nitrate reductase NapD
VIVLEGPDSGALGARLAEISAWEGVLSANMVFEQMASLAELGEQS